MLSRRDLLWTGGAFLAGLPSGMASAQDLVEIAMRGNADGSVVWFDPIGVLIKPGQTIRWTNRDPGNSHTSTAYHPDNSDHPQRIPTGATPWNSDYLLPDEFFTLVLTLPGVYDYFCIPHEQAGMVGRIVVADGSQPMSAPHSGDIPEVAKKAFPDVEDILRKGRVFAR